MLRYFRSHKQQQLFLLAFLLPFLIIMVLFMSQQITPWGNHNLLFSDVGTQYNIFLTGLRHDVLHHTFSQYSYYLGLGSNTLPTYAYYLMSPLNLIVIFFPASQIPTALTWIVTLKISLGGLTMAIFLSTTSFQNKKNIIILLFSTAYAVSSWVASVYYTLMWLDALLLLPMVCIGLDLLIYKHTSKLYFISLLAAIVTNYYMGYMTCLFAAIYFFYQFLGLQKNSEHFLTFIKQETKLIFHFVLISLLAVLSSMSILLPASLGMLATDKAALNWSNYSLLPTFGLGSLNQLGLGANNYISRLNHGPALFTGSCVFLLIVAFFFNQNVPSNEKKRTAATLLVLFLCMWINCFNTIWHLFQHPAGFPFRNALFFTFFAVCTAYRSIQYKPWHFLTVSQKFWTLFIPLASFCIGFIWKNIFKFNSNQSFSKLFSQAGLPSMKIWMSFILSICFYTMSWFLLFKLPLSKNVKLLLIALACAELMINFGLSMFGTPYGNQKNYVSNYQFKQKQITNLKHNSYFHHQGRTVVKDTSFQNAYNEKYNCYNDALLFRYFGISMYSSTLNKATRQDLEALGYLSVNPRRISFVGGTELTQSLLGVQNELDLNKNDAQLKINTTYFGLGTAIDQKILGLKLPQRQALKNQETILQRLVPAQKHYFKKVDLLKVHNHKKDTSRKFIHRITFRTTVAGPLYYYSQDASAELRTLRINNRSKKPTVDNQGQRMICPLGNYPKGQTIHLSVTTSSKHWDKAQQLFSLNAKQFDKAMNKTYERRFHLHQINGNCLYGTIDGTSSKQHLFLSIPYEKGWHAKVNHHSVKVQKGLRGFVILPINKGRNYVELHYRSPGLISGLFLSCVGLLLYVIFLFYEQKYFCK